MSSLDACVGEPGLLSRPSASYHWADYVVFALTLVISAIVGLYYGIKTRHRMSVRDMLLGGKDLNLYSVAFSLVATVTSTIFVLGVPSQTYFTKQWPLYVAFSFIPATVITVHIFIPIFHRLGVTSAYEYVGIRFNGIVRFMTALDFLAMMNLTQALTIYTPAVSFALVAGVPLEVSILAAGIVCTFYTALGGLRAVIVTDIFQISTVIIGIFGLFIKGAIDAGGIDKVFSQISSSDRLHLWSIHWTSDGTSTLWSQILGGTIIFLGLFSTNQTTVQRYCSVKKCRDAQKAAYVALIFYIFIWVLVLLVGLVIYSFYYTCDPMVLQIISNPDEILPLFVMDALGQYHGLPGLFSAAVFGAVLSSVSSGINSMSAVTLEDIIKPVYYRRKKKELEEYYCRSLTRTLALFYGMLSIGLSYIPVKYGTYILNLDMTFSAYGVLGGPVIGVFVLGIMFPLANSLGSGVGLVIGTLFGIWMWLGRLLCENSTHQKSVFPTPTECSAICNLTGYDPKTSTFKGFPAEKLYIDCPLQPLYDVSYLWYGLIGSCLTIAIGLIVSMVSGAHGAKRVSPDLLCWPSLKASLSRLCRKRDKNEVFTPTMEPSSQFVATPETKPSSTEEVHRLETPPRGKIVILRPDEANRDGDITTPDSNRQPRQPVPCYVEEEQDSNCGYQQERPFDAGGAIGVRQRGRGVNYGFVFDDDADDTATDNGIRVLHQPERHNMVPLGSSLVIKANPVRPLATPGADPGLDNAALSGRHVPYEDPVSHAAPPGAIDSNPADGYTQSNVPTLWS